MIYDMEAFQACKTMPVLCYTADPRRPPGVVPGVKRRPSPNLGTGRPSKSETGYFPPRVSGGSGIWVGNDGLHHRADGKGLAWF